MDDERIDLSPLDPSRDAARWDQMIESVATRASAGRQRPSPVAVQVVAWAPAALLLAAAAALVVWLAPTGDSARAPSSGAQQPAALALARWASTGELPETSDLLETLGGEHDAH